MAEIGKNQKKMSDNDLTDELSSKPMRKKIRLSNSTRKQTK